MIQIADLCSNKGVRKYDSSQGWTQVDSSWLKSTINLSGARGGEGKCIYKSTACSPNQNSEIEPRQRRHGGTSRESRDQRRLARPKCVCNSTTPCSLHEFFNYGALNPHGQSESNLILLCTVQSGNVKRMGLNGTRSCFVFDVWDIRKWLSLQEMKFCKIPSERPVSSSSPHAIMNAFEEYVEV